MTAESIKKERKTTTKRKVKAMVIAGMSERDIAKTLNKPKTTVHELIQKCITKDELAEFKNAEANILAQKRAEILNSIDHEDIKQASLMQRSASYGILFDKQALLEGRATSIMDVDIRHLIASITVPNSDNDSKNNTID